MMESALVAYVMLIFRNGSKNLQRVPLSLTKRYEPVLAWRSSRIASAATYQHEGPILIVLNTIVNETRFTVFKRDFPSIKGRTPSFVQSFWIGESEGLLVGTFCPYLN
jgi:hypothetical protein